MDIKYFELRAANKDCKETFSGIATQMFDKKPIFEHACNYVNNSGSYKRNGRKLEIIEIKDYRITVKLSSESPLEMASKSLAGFSRELLRVDKELNPDEGKRLFHYFIYKSTLFRNTQIDMKEIETERTDEMSDVDALKLCVDLFCNGMTTSKEEASMAASMKREIKKLLSQYDRFTRLNSYSSKMKKGEQL